MDHGLLWDSVYKEDVMKKKQRFGYRTNHPVSPKSVNLNNLGRVLLFVETLELYKGIHPLERMDILTLKGAIHFIQQEQREENR